MKFNTKQLHQRHWGWVGGWGICSPSISQKICSPSTSLLKDFFLTGMVCKGSFVFSCFVLCYGNLLQCGILTHCDPSDHSDFWPPFSAHARDICQLGVSGISDVMGRVYMLQGIVFSLNKYQFCFKQNGNKNLSMLNDSCMVLQGFAIKN